MQIVQQECIFKTGVFIEYVGENRPYILFDDKTCFQRSGWLKSRNTGFWLLIREISLHFG